MFKPGQPIRFPAGGKMGRFIGNLLETIFYLCKLDFQINYSDSVELSGVLVGNKFHFFITKAR